jgi:hypothetical protein
VDLWVRGWAGQTAVGDAPAFPLVFPPNSPSGVCAHNPVKPCLGGVWGYQPASTNSPESIKTLDLQCTLPVALDMIALDQWQQPGADSTGETHVIGGQELSCGLFCMADVHTLTALLLYELTSCAGGCRVRLR